MLAHTKVVAEHSKWLLTLAKVVANTLKVVTDTQVAVPGQMHKWSLSARKFPDDDPKAQRTLTQLVASVEADEVTPHPVFRNLT